MLEAQNQILLLSNCLLIQNNIIFSIGKSDKKLEDLQGKGSSNLNT